MKHNYRLRICYDGTRYNGWQKQGNTDCTIQGLLEDELEKYLQEKVDLKGSGRTDAGVHALCQVANFYIRKDVECSLLKQHLNRILPEDIRILEVDEVSIDFHSRKSAVEKTYEYCIWNSNNKNVFYRRYAYSVESPLNIRKMEQAAKLLCGTHDFLGFSSMKKSKKSTVRTVTKISFEQRKELLAISFTGSGFLYHMVRIMAGTLIEVGLEKKEPEAVLEVLEKRERVLAGMTVPARGLRLVSVNYM
ncbi:tRNA pseudouridine(38-40) synthase TruA [[Clostridium] polysaccharolyticum]|uniref:tRNA pseudouridine synthase A n=1 Tax=[Clostridium] polysaccharolyticum TaxID=29364 RepID=A0A1H9ZP52_9FIRM|nr:tRNA pseudouridine(38-40) synthase TruA [[Clostridium] polysaccharolyticum]SES83517.1 tRNA pseudouridine38-40 synthase [[Clostridium] polysaccharolyticum]